MIKTTIFIKILEAFNKAQHDFTLVWGETRGFLENIKRQTYYLDR
jgi:hypothetical protein